jgi:PIN domain nuclease of toxin-antitoxin system
VTVFDSSAILAFLFEEPGGDRVAERLRGGFLSSVNHCEVIERMLDRGQSIAGARANLARLQLEIVPFDAAQAERAAELRASTMPFGLSLGDRACIALAERLAATVMTADRQWGKAALPVEIEVIR